MSKLKNVMIYSDNEQINELYAAAKEIGESVSAFYIGRREDARGAERVYYLGAAENGRLHESYIPAMIEAIKEQRPDAVLMSTSTRCRMMAAAIAASFGTSVLTDCGELTLDGGLVSKRMVYGGAAFKTEWAGAFAVACLSPGAYEAAELPADPVCVEVPDRAAEGVVLTDSKAKIKESVNLAAAKKVVCIGRGCSGESSVRLAEEFAALTGSELGCTRPVAEDGIMAVERYVGISGVMLKPEVYLGVGISGQIQHMVGVNQSRTMFAINKDKDAPIFRNVDYGIVGEADAVLSRLVDMMKGK